MEKNYILKNILSNLMKDIKKQYFLVYFRKISIIDINETKITFGTLSVFMKGNLEAKFYDHMLKASKKEKESIEKIEFVVDKRIDNPSNTDVVDCAKFYKDSSKVQKSSFDMIQTNKKENLVSDRYSLMNFIVWPDNQLAYSACEAVSRKPWKAYNPLYIYWDVWLWKTHLLQATWNAIIKEFKDKTVSYITTDKFISDYVDSVKKRNVDKLRAKYTKSDILIIDDIQFLSKKEQTQNELYNIFNILYDSNKQIIISWDRVPRELKELEPRLRSRFEWGITVDIWVPDFETRLAILQEKSRQKEFLIPQDVAEFIASNVTENVRELEWILNQLVAEYELTWNSPVLNKVAQKLKQLSFTSDILGASKGRKKPAVGNYEEIIEYVSSHFGIEKDWILSDNRRKEFMLPRQVSMYLLKTKMDYTYERIGNIFNWRNHSSVLYACNKLERRLKKDRSLMQEINIIRDVIGI